MAKAQTDITSQYLKNADLSTVNSGWTYYSDSFKYTDWKTDGDVPVVEFYSNWTANPEAIARKDFKFSQKITLPAGDYRIAVNAFYRNGGGDGTNVDKAWIFAGEKRQNVAALTSAGVADYQGSNDLYKAANAFKKGDFSNAFDFTLDEETEIEVGFQGYFNLSLSWCILGPVKLYKYTLDAYISDYNAKVEEAQKLYDSPMNAGVLAALKEAATVDVESATKSAEITAAIQALTAAIADAEKSVAIYAATKTALDEYAEKVALLGAEGRQAYDVAAIQAAYDGRSMVDDQTSAVKNAYADAVKAQIADGTDVTYLAPAIWDGQSGTYNGLPEIYKVSSIAEGDVLTQTLTGLKSGIYTVSLKLAASYTSGRGFDCPTGNNLSVAFAQDKTCNLPVIERPALAEGEYTEVSFTVEVTDGMLKYGIKNIAPSGNWFVAGVTSIVYASDEVDDDEKVPEEITVEGILYAVRSKNLFINGSFDKGVEGWKTIDYTTDAKVSNFTITPAGGFDGGAYITTNGAGVTSETTIRQSVEVEQGKMYYFTVYTSGKAPTENNFPYNALFKMTDYRTENGVIKQFEWPQGAGNTSEQWSQTEYIFTAENPYVGVRMGWNQNSKFDGFALYEVEMLSSELDVAKAKAIAELEALSPVGEGLFYYSPEAIAMAREAIEAAETVGEVEAVVMPTLTLPKDGQAYIIANTTAEGNLCVADGAVTVAADAAVFFTAVEGGYAISNADGEYIFKTTDNDWTLSTTTDLAQTYVLTVNIVDGGYSITGAKGTLGTDTTAAGSTVYADKGIGNNGVWTIVEYVEPTTYVINIAEGIENGTVTANVNEAKAGETITLTVTPALGYKLDKLTVTYGENNAEVEVKEDYTFIMPEGDVTVSATFFYNRGIYNEVLQSEAYSYSLYKYVNFIDLEINGKSIDIIEFDQTETTNEISCNGYNAYRCSTEGLSFLWQSVGNIAWTYGYGLRNSGSGPRGLHIADLKKGQILVIQGTTGGYNTAGTNAEYNGFCIPNGYSYNANTNWEWEYTDPLIVEDISDEIHDAQDAISIHDKFLYLRVLEDGVLNLPLERMASLQGFQIWVTAPEFVCSPYCKVVNVDGDDRILKIWDGESTFRNEVKTYYSVDGTNPVFVTNDGEICGNNECDDSGYVKIYGTDDTDGDGIVVVKIATVSVATGIVSEVVTVEIPVGEITLNAPTLALQGFDGTSRLYAINWDNNTLCGEEYSFDVEGDGKHYNRFTIGDIINIENYATITVSAPGYKSSRTVTIEPDYKGVNIHRKSTATSHDWDFTNLTEEQKKQVMYSDSWSWDSSMRRAVLNVTVGGENMNDNGYGYVRDEAGIFHDINVDCPPNVANNSCIYVYIDRKDVDNSNLGAYFMSRPTFTFPHEVAAPGEFVVIHVGTGSSTYTDTRYSIVKQVPEDAPLTIEGVSNGFHVFYIDVYTHNGISEEIQIPELANPSFELSAPGTPLENEIIVANSTPSIYGWTIEGIGTQFSNTEVRKADSKSASTSQFGTSNPSDGEYSLFFRQGWNGAGNKITFTSDALSAIPAGDYVLSVDYKQHYAYDDDNQKNENTYVAIALNNGSDIIASAQSEPAASTKGGDVNSYFNDTEWKTLSVPFTIKSYMAKGSQVVITLNAAGARRSDFYIDNVQLKEYVEPTKLEIAKAKAIAELEALSPVGEGLFYYSPEAIAMAREAIEAAETVGEVEAVVMPTRNIPDPDKAYILSLTTSAGTYQLNTDDGIRIEKDGTPVYFVAQDGGTFALYNGEKYVNYEGGNNWNLAATADAYGWTITAVDGGYTIAGKNGLLGTNKPDGNGAGSACYGDKSTTNGNFVWTILVYEDFVVDAYLRNVAEAEALYDEPMNKDVLQALKEAVVDPSTLGSVAEIVEMVTVLSNAITDAKESIGIYAATKATLDEYTEKAAQLDEEGQDAFEEYVADIRKAYNDRTMVDDQTSAIENAYIVAVKVHPDMASLFIRNPHFMEDEPLLNDNGITTFDYDMANPGNINGRVVDYYGMQPVTEWEASNLHENSYASGVFSVGSNSFLGGAAYLPPTTMSDGSTEGNLLGLVTCWGETAQYRQSVTLPKGKYVMAMSYYNSGGASVVAKNLIGFVADSGAEHLGTTTAFPVGKWTADMVMFELDERTSGYFTLGYTATNSGSSNMPHFFIDGISIFYIGDALDSAKKELQEMYAEAVALRDTTEYFSYEPFDLLVDSVKALCDNGYVSMDDQYSDLEYIYVMTSRLIDGIEEYKASAKIPFADELALLMSVCPECNEYAVVASHITSVDVSGLGLTDFPMGLLQLPNLMNIDASANNIADIFVSNVYASVIQQMDINLRGQDIDRTIDLDYEKIVNYQDIMESLPSLPYYDKATNSYMPNGLSVRASTVSPLSNEGKDTECAIQIDLSSGKPDLSIESSSGRTYYGESGDTLYITYPGASPEVEGSFFRARFFFEQGDANFVEGVDANDLQATILYDFGEYDDYPFNFTAADTYKDGKINVQDVICTVNILLADDDVSEAGTKRRMASMLDAETGIADAYVYAKDGQIILHTDVPVAAISVKTNGNVSWNVEKYGLMQSCTKANVVGYSLSGATLSAGEYVLGTYSGAVAVTSASLSDSKAQNISVAIGERVVTGIDGISGDDAEEIYDVSGRKLNSKTNGVNIIKQGKRYIKVNNK